MSQTNWFDLAPLLGETTPGAFLSQRNSHYRGISLAKHRENLARELGLAVERISIPGQIHGPKIQLAVPGQIHEETDGLFTNDPDVVLTLQVADCAAVFFYHAATGFRGLVHAGWRGLAAGVLKNGAELLKAHDVELNQAKVVIGPTIEQACYEVGSEVVEHFSPALWQPNSNGRYQLDLAGAVREQLQDAGIAAEKISSLEVCTRCDPRCHSYRREGAQAGRMIAFYYQQL
ncbi:MAG: polyphenol oxidase family protein [Fidelibacterota bacterium]|nr:MAG: polyphenol oxidase family protein [Candidatus Neomarinimicrobiota bacterium]